MPNGVLVGIDAAGTVSIFAGAPAPVDVLVDVTGWVPAGAGFTPITPIRVLETRAGSPGYTGGSRFGRNETRLVDVVGRAGLPAGQVGAVAVNLTATGPTGNGFLKTYPSDAAVPPTSSLNFSAGQVVANSQVLGVGPDGAVAVFAYLDAATDGVDVVIDVTGWFSPDRTFHPIAPAAPHRHSAVRRRAGRQPDRRAARPTWPRSTRWRRSRAASSAPWP